MAEIEAALPPTHQAYVVDHHERAAFLSSIKEAFPSHELQHENGDNKRGLDTEEVSELYDPNVYEGAFRSNLTPH